MDHIKAINTKEKDIMKLHKSYFNRAEIIKFFNRLAFEFDTIFSRTGDLEAKGKSEAYELAAFNI